MSPGYFSCPAIDMCITVFNSALSFDISTTINIWNMSNFILKNIVWLRENVPERIWRGEARKNKCQSVKSGVGFINGLPPWFVCFLKGWGGAQRRRALSIIYPTCHHGNPPEGGQGSVRTNENLWGVNLNRRETATEGQEEGNDEDDRWQARMGERKVQGEGGHRGEGEMARGVTGDCCSGSDRK